MEDEVLKYYFDEVKVSQLDINTLEEEEHIPNEAEQAATFLQKAGLDNLNQLHEQGKEIPENAVLDWISQKQLTEKQAQTVRSRVTTLNRTLRSRQTNRKQRRDVRDVTWNHEWSSTGTRSRSVTPDSLDSDGNPNSLTSDEDQQLTSLPLFPLEHNSDIKRPNWPASDSRPIKKFNRYDNRSDVAHLESDTVVLKAYQPLSENGSVRRVPRERSGSDPTTETKNLDLITEPVENIPKSQNSIVTTRNNCSTVYINSPQSLPNELLSFESLIRQNESTSTSLESALDQGVSIEELTDSEYQYLKPLLYVELIAIFDQYKITHHKKKASIKNKGGNVFGVNLSTLVMRDMPRPSDNSMLPQIFRSVIGQLNERCLNEDGLLRVGGHKQKLESLYNEVEEKFYSNRKHVEQLFQQATAHELTGVLKKLLRDIPDPIFTMELFDMFYKAGSIPNYDDKVKALNLLVLMLPVEHRNTFKLLIEFFQNVIDHKQANRMGLLNVAMITAPSFFPPRLLLPKDHRKHLDKHLTQDELAKQIKGAAVCCCLMETLLKAGKKLWIVPNYLALQAREAQRKAQVRKDMGKDKNKKIRAGKAKLVRSSTQYEPGVMNVPRIKMAF